MTFLNDLTKNRFDFLRLGKLANRAKNNIRAIYNII